MMVEVCVGSACHLKDSEVLVDLFTRAIEEHRLEDEIILMGSFCTGQCSRLGVTVTIDDVVYPGVTRESFKEFFEGKILSQLSNESR